MARLFAALCTALLLCAARSTAALSVGGCYESGAVGFYIPYVNSSAGMCPPGWYCPNSFINNVSTYPAICPASDACVQNRMHYTPCGPQGLYEPQPCLRGQYCPSSYERRECPSGSYCPAWSTEPKKCNGLSYCPTGSHTDYFVGIVLVLAIIDGAVIAAYIGFQWYLRQPSALSEESSAGPDAETDPIQTIARLIRESLEGTVPVNISFENLSIRLAENHATAPGKALLQNVTGSIRAGEVTAIMGPTGVGKTVLFTTLLGKEPNDWKREGTLHVCGNSALSDFPHVVGFVPQDDVLFGELTVAENVRYANETRTPAHWSSEKRLELRSAVLRALGLTHVRDVLIGDDEMRGVSGGQRKRCSIALEIVAAPAVLFLDEPTTGLDATASLNVIRILKNIAREANIPIAVVIHQPRVEIWEELDSVLMLASGGRAVYSGKRAGVHDYMTAVLQQPIFEGKGNPADIVMDVISEHGQLLADAWEREVQVHTPLLPATDIPVRRIASPLKQFAMAHLRGLIRQTRKANVFMMDVAMSMIGATMLTASAIDGALLAPYNGAFIALSPRSDVQVVSMLFMLLGIAQAGALGPSGVRALGTHRPQYWREAGSGFSKLAYYLGTSTAEFYRVVLTMLHFAAVVYLMWKPYMSFGSLYWLLLLYAVILDGQSQALGNVIPPAIAPLLATVAGVFAALFNGFPAIPGSPGFYAFGVTELAYKWETADLGENYYLGTLNTQWGYNLDQSSKDYGIIFAWLFGLRLLGYVLMVGTNRDKQK